ncbi:radical SAM protein [Oerskovia enterophila]|uniref:Cyclic pyranopterin monophosphate synthase n=1 Tax=Oerskovia enterophila TaxID=43678 RepID=A0ABX2Y8L3_9CELL|nr:radical SAM protein [Oerskovia enterophila]OCI32603.1 cyclic pyranopterin monophosphate synthase [Oerskovia enterophila]
MVEPELVKEPLCQIDGRPALVAHIARRIACWFCHNEGAVTPQSVTPATGSMLKTETAVAVIRAAIVLGSHHIYITGGEPLLHPGARTILESIPEHSSKDYSVALVSNATLLPRAIGWLEECHIEKIKLSLHYLSDSSFASIAATRMPVRAVTNAIRLAAERLPKVEINTLVQPQNLHEIRDIMLFADEVGADLQLLQLVETEFNARSENRVDGDTIKSLLSAECGRPVDDSRVTGQTKLRYQYRGVSVVLIDSSSPAVPS